MLICNVKRPDGCFHSPARTSLPGFILLVSALPLVISACSMSEEVKRIRAVSEMEKQKEASRSTNLTGEQVFIRSCNTCHPRGRQGMGPSLDKLNEHFPNDAMLKTFIRQGKALMPPQPPETLNDKELDNLVNYLRQLEVGK